MCGIVGFLENHPSKSATAVLNAMLDAIRHRGPDGAGTWSDQTGCVHFGHRRLAILDLSSNGAQPMVSRSARYVITFNGEIYNFQELRVELASKGHSFAGSSDTEVLLAAIEEWGVVEATKRCRGMFAFAVCDQQRRVLWLVRDRLGEKPLYYGASGGVFFFASELKALRRHPSWAVDIDRGALALFFRHGYVPGPFSIYAGIQKLEPGCAVQVGYSAQQTRIGTPETYWSAETIARRPSGPLVQTFREAADELEGLLSRAVGRQMVADVPLGAFLSGGVDSSLVVALMQRQSRRPVKTFTIGFEEGGYDEAPFARALATQLGTEHTELYMRSVDALAVIPRLPEIFDEPFADSSQIPTFLISELVRRSVTVSLSGDGGDELFSGYSRYGQALAFKRRLGWVPRWMRAAGARLIRRVPPKGWQAMLGGPAALVLGAHWRGRFGDRLHKFAGLLPQVDARAVYQQMVSSVDAERLVLGAHTPRSRLEVAVASDVKGQDFIGAMSYFDLISYLPDDILVKVDRAAMAVALETRVPLLDHSVVEFALSLPSEFKRREGCDKAILREVLFRHVPRSLIERPKMGFGVPINEWLRGPLRDWAETLLDARRIKEEGFLDPVPIRRMWDEHQRSERFWHYNLWAVLMFQAWLEHTRYPQPYMQSVG